MASTDPIALAACALGVKRRPTRRLVSLRATSGQAAVAPAMSAMTSRRLIGFLPKLTTRHPSGSNYHTSSAVGEPRHTSLNHRSMSAWGHELPCRFIAVAAATLHKADLPAGGCGVLRHRSQR